MVTFGQHERRAAHEPKDFAAVAEAEDARS